jgi:hypothetical protein
VAPYVPPATGGSNVISGAPPLAAESNTMQMNGFFGFVMLMMGLQ